MYLVLLFYKYCDIVDTNLIILWQKDLCKRLGLLGRILISSEGINGTLCGTDLSCKEYIEIITSYNLFFDIDFKKSRSSFICFDFLHIKYKDEIVILRENKIDINYKDSAKKIDCDDLHNLLKNKENIVLLDVRNSYESRIGKFVGAICPLINTSRDFKNYFKENADIFKNKKIIMYCTGGVRCERISVLFKKYVKAKDILSLKNGIHSYVEKYKDGYFRGRNYVFDDRVSIKINEDIITSCDLCFNSCDLYNNCLNALCNKQYICCDICFKEKNMCCSDICLKLTQLKQVPLRPELKSRMIL
jgi:UPF0176 protein